MRRMALAGIVASVAAIGIAACGSTGSPSPLPGGGGGGGGGQQPPPNTPPQVKSITVSDTRVEVGTPVTLTATVEDAETPIADLLFAWSFPSGSTTATGNGSTITWTPGSDLKTPADFEIGLMVTERFTSGGIPVENKATGSVTVHVNNSPKELADLSMRFLTDFANSSVPPAKCVAEFSDSCGRGKNDEFNDIDDNRHDFLIVSSTLRTMGVEVAVSRQTAKVHTFCSFTSRIITTQPRDENCQNGACPLGSQGTAQGDCWTTNVYENGRWWLCESHFTGQAPLNAFTRAFFGIRRYELP